METAGGGFDDIPISDLFPLVAGPQDGGINRSNATHMDVARLRIKTKLEEGTRAFFTASFGCTDVAVGILAEAARVGRGVHVDEHVDWFGHYRVRVRVFTRVSVSGCPVSVVLIGSQHVSLSRLPFVACTIMRAHLAFTSLGGWPTTKGQVKDGIDRMMGKEGGVGMEESFVLFWKDLEEAGNPVDYRLAREWEAQGDDTETIARRLVSRHGGAFVCE